MLFVDVVLARLLVMVGNVLLHLLRHFLHVLRTVAAQTFLLRDIIPHARVFVRVGAVDARGLIAHYICFFEVTFSQPLELRVLQGLCRRDPFVGVHLEQTLHKR